VASRKAEQPSLLEPVELRCEVCGEPTPTRLPRTATGGLLCCYSCLNKSNADVALTYVQRLRRIAER
jgi:formylmethanofuran dehydrogenase subunit E